MDELSFKMDLWIEKHYNVILEGKHGVGKTELIKKKFDEHKLNWLYFSASTMDPWVDFIGIPREKTENGIEFTDLVRPRYLAEDSIDAIFLDEYNRAPKKIRNATMELIQFKSINGKKFNRLKFIWVAINPENMEEKYDIEKLDEAQRDRFQIYYRVPYDVSSEYFHTKYGEKGIIATKWWRNLEGTKKDLISPRRLDYCLDYYNNNGDLGDVLNPEINYHSLISQLEDGLYSEKLTELFNSKNGDGAVKAFKSENFYNNTIETILKNSSMMEYFIDKLPKEKVIVNIIQNYPFALAATNKLNFFEFSDSIKEIIAAKKANSKIIDALKRWEKREVIAALVSSFSSANFSSQALLYIAKNIEATDASMRKEIFNIINEYMTNNIESKKVNISDDDAAAILIYMGASKYPTVMEDYTNMADRIYKASPVADKDGLLDICIKIVHSDNDLVIRLGILKEIAKLLDGVNHNRS
jgi:hypothetical protein